MLPAPRRLCPMKPSTVLSIVVDVSAIVGWESVGSANHSWGGYHWARTANPFTLAVGDNVSSIWDLYLNEAIYDWRQSEVLNLVKVGGGARGRNCRATSGRIEVCNASYGNTGWLGIAQIWASG